jgi:hypothetical protein
MAEGAYKGPRSNRRMLNKNTVFVSKEELADFKKRFGADKTLRDLLNADKTGKLPEAAKASAAKAGPRRSEAKADAAKGAETLERMKSRAERGMRVRSNEEMRDRFRDEAIGYGTAAAGLAAGPLRALAGTAAKKSSEKMTGALRERMSREEPRGDAGVEIKPAVFRRLREEAKDPLEGRRVGDVAKELKEQAKREAERAATKRATQFRSRTADRMEGYAKGGMAKKKRK